MSTCPGDTAVHPSPHCGIGRRAPLRNASWDTGESPAVFAPEGFSSFRGHASSKKRRLFDSLALEEKLLSVTRISTRLRGTPISSFLTHGSDLGGKAGRMGSSECFKLFAVILCCSSLVNGKNPLRLMRMCNFLRVELHA